MAESDPKSGRAPMSMPDRGRVEAEEDPLVELARIVSEDGGFSTPKQEKPKMNRNEPAKRTSYAEGLEAELLQELESSLGGREIPAPAPQRAAAPRPVAPPSNPRPAPPLQAARASTAPERDPDDLLRSIEEQLGQFERRQAERAAVASAPAAAASAVNAEAFEDEALADEAPGEEFAAAPVEELPAAEPLQSGWRSRIAHLRPIDDDDAEVSPAPAWEPEAEPALTTRSDYRFRGPANAEWDHPKPEPDEPPIVRSAQQPVEPRTRHVEGLMGFDSDESTDADLFAPSGKSNRARDLFGDEPIQEVEEQSRFSAEGTRRRRIADAFPEFDEPAADASSDERAAINARLAEALESDYADPGLGPNQDPSHGKAWESADDEEDGDEPRVAAAVASGASRRAAAARAQAAQRSKGARTVMLTALGVVVVVLIGGAAALYLRSMESGPAAPPPVIAADASPVKVTPPEDQAAAGGETVGEAVYNRVAGNAPAGDEQVVDNAEEPREVARIVLPQSQTEGSDTIVRPVGEDTSATDSSSAAAPTDEIGPRRVPTFTVRPDGTIVANSDSAGEAAAPAAAVTPQVAVAEPAAPQANLPTADQAIGGTDTTMTPRPAIEEPQVAVVAPPKPAAPAPAEPAANNEAPVNLLSGNASAAAPAPAAANDGYLVQVSSQRSMDQAQSSYADIQRRYPSVLGNLNPVIQEADLGAKGIYFRVRVGPWSSRDDAIQVCESLKAAGGSCFVTQ